MATRRFDVGDVFTDGFRVWWKNIGQLLGLTLIVLVPGGLLITLLLVGFATEISEALFNPEAFEDRVTNGEFPADILFRLLVVGGVAAILGITMYQIILIAVTKAVDAVMNGQRIVLGHCLSGAVRHFMPVLAAILVTAIPILAGVLLCLLPGVCLIVLWYVVVPVIVVEGRGPIEALRRSWELVKSQFGYVLLIVIALFAINMALGVVVAIFSVISPVLEVVGNLISNALFTSLAPVFQGVVYFHLKRSLEGDPADQVADVFE